MEIEIGDVFIYTRTGKEIEISKVTEKRISWYTGNISKGGSGKNNLRMAWASVRQFEEGIIDGTYKPKFKLTDGERSFINKYILS